MAPPKAALDFVDFVNDSPTRMMIALSLCSSLYVFMCDTNL